MLRELAPARPAPPERLPTPPQRRPSIPLRPQPTQDKHPPIKPERLRRGWARVWVRPLGGWRPPLPDTPEGFSGGKYVAKSTPVNPANNPFRALEREGEALDEYYKSPLTKLLMRYEGADKFFATHPDYGVPQPRRVVDVKATKENVRKWYESLPPWAREAVSGIVHRFLNRKSITEADWQKFKAELKVFLGEAADAMNVKLPSLVMKSMGLPSSEDEVAWDHAAAYAADYHVTDIGNHAGDEELLLSRALQSDPINILAGDVRGLEEWSRKELSKGNPLAVAGIVGTVLGGFGVGVLDALSAAVRPATYVAIYNMLRNPEGTLRNTIEYLSKYPASGLSMLAGSAVGGVGLKAFTAGELESLVEEGAISPQAAKVIWDLTNTDVKVGQFLKYHVDRLLGKLSGKYIEDPGFKFTPSFTDPIRPEDLIRRYGNTLQTTIHVSKSSAWDEWLTDKPDADTIVLRGFPDEASGFRKEYDLLHFYKSLPTDEGVPQAYMAYAVGTGEGFGGVDFSLFGPRIKALVFRDLIDYVPPKPGEDLASYSARIGMMSGKTVIPPENVFGKSIERQVITPAKFKGNLIDGEYPGSLIRFKGYRGFTYWKRLPPEPLRKIPVLRDLFSDYYKVHVIDAETLPVDDDVIEDDVVGSGRAGRARVVEYDPLEAYASREELPLAYSIPSVALYSIASEPLPLTRRTRVSGLRSTYEASTPRKRYGSSLGSVKADGDNALYSITHGSASVDEIVSRLVRSATPYVESFDEGGVAISHSELPRLTVEGIPRVSKVHGGGATVSADKELKDGGGNTEPLTNVVRVSKTSSSVPRREYEGSEDVEAVVRLTDVGSSKKRGKRGRRRYVVGGSRRRVRKGRLRRGDVRSVYYEVLYPAVRITDLV